MKSAITVVEGKGDNCVGHNAKKNSKRQDPNLWKSSLLALQDPLEVMLRLVFMRLYWCDPSEWWYLKTLLIWQVRILMTVTIMTFFREWSYISHVIENALVRYLTCDRECTLPVPSPAFPSTNYSISTNSTNYSISTNSTNFQGLLAHINSCYLVLFLVIFQNLTKEDFCWQFNFLDAIVSHSSQWVTFLDWR